MGKLIHEIEPELKEEVYYVCGIEGCYNMVFDEEARHLICIAHGDTSVKLVRQFQNGNMISEFKEKLAKQRGQ